MPWTWLTSRQVEHGANLAAPFMAKNGNHAEMRKMENNQGTTTEYPLSCREQKIAKSSKRLTLRGAYA
jgi:hypothetical protein